MRAARRMRAAWAVAAALVASGCYESVRPLSAPGEVAVDAALVGTWACRPAKPDAGESATIRVIPFDEAQYVVEWAEGNEVTRYRVYGSRAGDVTLLNVREVLTKLPAGKWLFVRYRMPSANELSFAIVKDEAVTGKDEAERLDLIRRDAASEGLYTPFAVCQRL